MNNANTQQPTKKIGKVSQLRKLQAAGSISAGIEAARLLTNGGTGGYPAKFENQKQKRKLARQMQRKVS